MGGYGRLTEKYNDKNNAQQRKKWEKEEIV